MNRNHLYTFLLLVIGSSLCAQVTTQHFDQDIDPDVIFGSGNANGAWTTNFSTTLDTATATTIQLGLRAKLRFDAANSPQNYFSSNGDGTYSFTAISALGGFGWAPGDPIPPSAAITPIWNFEWSVNTGLSTPGASLDSYTYELGIDFDPSAATDFLKFDPIIVAAGQKGDHAIGDNTTPNGGGVSAKFPGYSAPTFDAEGKIEYYYEWLLEQNSVAQNSWNMVFFKDYSPKVFDPTVPGIYTIYLSAFDGSTLIATNEIEIHAVPVPEPSTYAAISFVICIAGLIWRRRIRQRK